MTKKKDISPNSKPLRDALKESGAYEAARNDLYVPKIFQDRVKIGERYIDIIPPEPQERARGITVEPYNSVVSKEEKSFTDEAKQRKDNRDKDSLKR